MITTAADIYILTGFSMGIIIVVAVVVVAFTTLYIMKPISPKNGIARTQKQPVEDIETSATPLPQSRLNILAGGRRSLRLWVRRIFQRRNISPDPPPTDEEQATNEPSSIPLPGVTSPESEINDVSLSVNQGMPNMEPANEEETLATPLPQPDEGQATDGPSSIPLPGVTSPESEINDVSLSVNQEMPNMEPVNEEETKVNMSNAFPTEPVEFTQGKHQGEPEPSEPESEELKEDSQDEDRKPAVTEDSMFDLFTTEEVEENDSSKLAESLNDVGARDLLGEAQSLINQLKQYRER